MLSPGPAKKITIHLNEDTSAKHDFLYKEIFSFLHGVGVAGATMLRPAAGFGSHHRTHAKEQGEHLPVRIEFIEEAAVVASLMPALCALITDGLVEEQEITVLKLAVREEPS